MYPNMYSDVSAQIFIFASLAIFTGGVSACFSWLIDKEKRRMIQVGAIIALALVSLVAFFFRPDKSDLAGIIILFIAILWFPAAIVLSSLVVPGISGTRSLPYWVLTVSAMVYMAEFFLDAYIGPDFGLRSSHVLIIIPPPALPYAIMQIPDSGKVVIQFVTTFLLASLIFWLGLRLSRHDSPAAKADA